MSVDDESDLGAALRMLRAMRTDSGRDAEWDEIPTWIAAPILAELDRLRAIETAARMVYGITAPDEPVPGGVWEALRLALGDEP